jgi:hypothetical protein
LNTRGTANAIGGDSLSREKLKTKASTKTGHDILLARKQDDHRPGCPTKLHPPYMHPQKKDPQHKKTLPAILP